MNRKVLELGRSIIKKLPYGDTLVDYFKMKLFGVYRKRMIKNRAGVFYQLNNEEGLIDLDERDAHGPFEWPDMIIANQAIGNMWLTPDIRSVINIGSGVGTFEDQNAKKNPTVQFLASEMDATSTEWAIKNRSYPNVKYCTDSMGEIIKKCPPQQKYDLAVSIDVIEHVADYKSFLDEFAQLADKAVISTPNRDRPSGQISGPRYKGHVQEFDAGELFFILKMYYRKVELFSAPDVSKPELIPVGIYSSYDKLFAYCER